MRGIYIYIPTRGRVDYQKTWDRLPPHLRLRTKLVCPIPEAAAHQERGRIVLPCSVNKMEGMCLAETRDWILKIAAKEGHERIAILDDDVTLLKRRPLVKGKLPRFTTAYDEKEWMEAFDWMDTTLETFAHAAWGMRQHHWDFETNKKKYIDVGRALGCCMGFNVEKVQEVGATFTKGIGKGSPMSDFNMTLQLLRAGFKNRISLVFRASPGPANAPGGCSGFRSAALQSSTAKKLAALYSGFVQTREKCAWGGMESEKMLDVKVFWKRALRLPQ